MEFIKRCMGRPFRQPGQYRRCRRIRVKGSAVIEMAYIIPLFLGVFVLLVQTVFYYHDKAVLNGAAAETAILGAQAARRPETEYDLEAFFRGRTQDRLIFLTDPDVTVREGEDEIQVSVSARKTFMKLEVCQKAFIVQPEIWIRRTG